MRPVIGVTTSVEEARWDIWADVVVLQTRAYVDCVRAAGGRAVLLPPDPDGADLLERLDGLVVSGGSDIRPARYGAADDPATFDVRDDQDESELALVAAALARGTPVLGICRGMQLLAVAHGGSLHQHLPSTPGHEQHGAWGSQWSEHRVDLAEGSRVAALLGSSAVVNSGHHQGVADAGRLTVTGRSPDGLIEAVEAVEAVDPAVDGRDAWVVGVQWHPEMIGQLPLFAALVEAAGARLVGAAR